MADALSIALQGVNKSLARVAADTTRVVNASSTINAPAGASPEENLSTALVDLKIDSTTYAANAKVIKKIGELNKTLLDTIA